MVLERFLGFMLGRNDGVWIENMNGCNIRLSVFAILMFLWIPLSTPGVACAELPETLQLSVEERAGTDRTDDWVQCGVPLPRSWNVTDVGILRLTDSAGIPIPAQFEPLARWGASATTTTAAVKWVLVGFFHTIRANATDTLFLDRDGPGAAASHTIQTDSSVSGKLFVDTGTAQFEINTESTFNLIHQVTIDGIKRLTPLSANTAIDASLEMVTGGTPNSIPRTRQVTVERSGTLCTIVKAVGSIAGTSGSPLLDYTTRFYFFAGSTTVRLDFTVENNHPVLTGTDGQPTNVHRQGAVNSIYMNSLKLAFKPDPAGGALRVLSESSVDISTPDNTVRLYQDSSGNSYWDAYVGSVGWLSQLATPRLQSYCTQPGYSISAPGTSIAGNQALGWMAVLRGNSGGVTVTVKDFWQKFPKVVQSDSGGTLSVDLFPNGLQFRHNLRVGEEKTHSILVDFNTTEPSSVRAQNLAKAFNKPLFALATAQWVVESGVLGEVPIANLQTWPLYENYVNTGFRPNPDVTDGQDTGFGNSTLMAAIERYNFYGWQDFGDLPLDYEAFGENQAGQMNLKYWYLYGMLTQLFRSGNTAWLDLILPAANHLADIDFLHIPDNGIQHWSHGAYFGHSDHDEPGNDNPNRNFNSPSVDLFFGVPDLLLAYYLTGNPRFAKVAEEGLAALDNLSAQFADFSYPVFYRERANLIFAFIEGYRQTGDSRWLNNLKAIVGPTADTTTKSWLNAPLTYDPPDGGPQGDERISGFQLGQVAWTLGRYLDFCEEYDLNDDLKVAAALADYGDFIIDHLLYDIPSWFRQNSPGEETETVLAQYEGHVATIDSIWFTTSYETYLEVNNWSLLLADVLAYAYKYSGTDRYLETAADLYTTGTLDPVWINDPPVYMATKDLVNALNWGLVYMNTASDGGNGGGSGNQEEAIDGGYDAFSGLWIKAILQVAGKPTTLVWRQVGSDTTPSGDRVVSGYFYADPAEFAYGSVYNPEVFVKIYVATNGWCNIAFNHVTVDSVTVDSAYGYKGTADQSGTITLNNRLAEHQYTGVSDP